MDLLKIKTAVRRPDRADRRDGCPRTDLNDLGRVRRQLEAKLPAAMAGSGYILQVDHSVPPQVNYETYRYFVEKGLEMGTLLNEGRDAGSAGLQQFFDHRHQSRVLLRRRAIPRVGRSDCAPDVGGPAAGFKEVVVPGVYDFRTREKRLAEGIAGQ